MAECTDPERVLLIDIENTPLYSAEIRYL